MRSQILQNGVLGGGWGLVVSRLARNSSDWHRLSEICSLTDTLILDEDGLYNPGHFIDRLLLGLKGTMSEAEFHVPRARLQGGIENKARRGELKMRLPIGLAYDEQDRVVLDPDRTTAWWPMRWRQNGTAGFGPWRKPNSSTNNSGKQIGRWSMKNSDGKYSTWPETSPKLSAAARKCAISSA